MICEAEGYRWDALLLCETWRHDKAEIWETSQTHIHGCWCHLHHNRGQPPTHQTDECILHPLGICGSPHRKMYKMIEKHTENCKRCILKIGGDFNAEQGLGHGNECISVGRYTLNEGNKRGDWMKHWLMLQGYTALQQENTSETNDFRFSKRKRKTN